MKFLLDTNFLMIPGQFRVDIFGQLEQLGPVDLCVTDLSVRELEKLAKNKGRKGAHARLALLLIQWEGVEVVPSGKTTHADEAIRRIAKREGMVVCTLDKGLKAALKRRGIRVVTLRQKKYLGFEC